MQESRGVFELETHWGEPVTAGDVTVTAQSQALTIRWPRGGFVWNRPLAVLVKQGGDVDRIPVVDITLWSQVVLFGLSIIFSMKRVASRASWSRSRPTAIPSLPARGKASRCLSAKVLSQKACPMAFRVP